MRGFPTLFEFFYAKILPLNISHIYPITLIDVMKEGLNMIEKVSNSPLTDFQVKPVEGTPKIKEKSADPQTQNPKHQGPTKEKMEKVIDSMNNFLKESNTHLKFQYHDELQKYYVAIVDDQTNEVIKEIPPKKLLDMYAAMADYLGLLVDKKV